MLLIAWELVQGGETTDGVYTQALNKRDGRVGRLFQSRFEGFSAKENHFLEAMGRLFGEGLVGFKAVSTNRPGHLVDKASRV